jgi:hypothetical protein
LRLTESEKQIISFVSLLSGHTQNDCKEIFLAFLMVLAIALKKGDKHIDVPFLGKVGLDAKKVQVKNKFEIANNFNFELSPAMKMMVQDIVLGKETLLQKYVKDEIVKLVAEKLDVTEDELRREKVLVDHI